MKTSLSICATFLARQAWRSGWSVFQSSRLLYSIELSAFINDPHLTKKKGEETVKPKLLSPFFDHQHCALYRWGQIPTCFSLINRIERECCSSSKDCLIWDVCSKTSAWIQNPD